MEDALWVTLASMAGQHISMVDAINALQKTFQRVGRMRKPMGSGSEELQQARVFNMFVTASTLPKLLNGPAVTSSDSINNQEHASVAVRGSEEEGERMQSQNPSEPPCLSTVDVIQREDGSITASEHGKAGMPQVQMDPLRAASPARLWSATFEHGDAPPAKQYRTQGSEPIVLTAEVSITPSGPEEMVILHNSHENDVANSSTGMEAVPIVKLNERHRSASPFTTMEASWIDYGGGYPMEHDEGLTGCTADMAQTTQFRARSQSLDELERRHQPAGGGENYVSLAQITLIAPEFNGSEEPRSPTTGHDVSCGDGDGIRRSSRIFQQKITAPEPAWLEAMERSIKATGKVKQRRHNMKPSNNEDLDGGKELLAVVEGKVDMMAAVVKEEAEERAAVLAEEPRTAWSEWSPVIPDQKYSTHRKRLDLLGMPVSAFALC